MRSSSLPHEVLGVSASATAKQVRKAYKRLARKVHPDRDPSPEATTRFVAVKNAHDEMLRQINAGGYRVPRASGPASRPHRAPTGGGPRRGPQPPPPRRPPPRRTPPPRDRSKQDSWVEFDVAPEAPPPPRAWTTRGPLQIPRYKFELSDFLRPALYIFGIGSWLFIMTTFASNMGMLRQATAQLEEADETVAEKGLDTASPPSADADERRARVPVR